MSGNGQFHGQGPSCPYNGSKKIELSQEAGKRRLDKIGGGQQEDKKITTH